MYYIANAAVTLLQKLLTENDGRHDSDTHTGSADDTDTTSPSESLDSCHLGTQYVIDTETGTDSRHVICLCMVMSGTLKLG